MKRLGLTALAFSAIAAGVGIHDQHALPGKRFDKLEKTLASNEFCPDDQLKGWRNSQSPDAPNIDMCELRDKIIKFRAACEAIQPPILSIPPTLSTTEKDFFTTRDQTKVPLAQLGSYPHCKPSIFGNYAPVLYPQPYPCVSTKQVDSSELPDPAKALDRNNAIAVATQCGDVTLGRKKNYYNQRHLSDEVTQKLRKVLEQ